MRDIAFKLLYLRNLYFSLISNLDKRRNTFKECFYSNVLNSKQVNTFKLHLSTFKLLYFYLLLLLFCKPFIFHVEWKFNIIKFIICKRDIFRYIFIERFIRMLSKVIFVSALYIEIDYPAIKLLQKLQ